MALIDEIEAFLERTKMSATAFGKIALNDPPFVQQVRDGRDVKWSTVEKVRAFMADWQPPEDLDDAAKDAA